MKDLDPDYDWDILQKDGFSSLLGPIAHTQVAEDEWRFCLDVTAQLLNVGGVCHGGASLTLLDTGMGRSAWLAGGRRPCATIQLDSHFIAAAKEGQRIEGIAKVLRRTPDVAFMEGELWAGGRMTMRASGVWKFLNKGK